MHSNALLVKKKFIHRLEKPKKIFQKYMKIKWTKQYASNINCTACPQVCQMKDHMSVASILQQMKTSTWAWHPMKMLPCSN